MTTNLIHKFIFIEYADYVQSGQIIGMACEHVYLVRVDPNNNPPVCVLIPVSDMVESNACFIFESRTEMDNWISWLERDDDKDKSAKVVSLVQH